MWHFILIIVTGLLITACASGPQVPEEEQERLLAPEEYDYGPEYEGDGDFLDDNPYSYY